MKINKKVSNIQQASTSQQHQQHQMHSQISEAALSRKHSLRENSTTFQNTQPLNFNSLGLSGNDKMSSIGQQNILSESQPVLAKANDKPNILLSSNNSQITVHKRNPSHQFSQQISLNELALGSLSGSSGGGGAYMLKLQKYKKMKSELAASAATNNQNNLKSSSNHNNNAVKKGSLGYQNQGSATAATTSIISNNCDQLLARNQNILGSQQSHKVSANNSIAMPNPQAFTVVQSTKNSHTQQIIFNQHPSQIIEAAVGADSHNKENTNQVANSQHYLQFKQQSENMKSQKASTLKFSINNLLSEITQKTTGGNSTQTTNKPHHPTTITSANNSTLLGSNNNNNNNNNNASQNKLMMQNIIAAKNHSTLISQKHVINSSSLNVGNNNTNKSLLSSNSNINNQHQQQLASSKMMMALHKKCNSIANTSSVSNYIINNGNQQQQQQQSQQSLHGRNYSIQEKPIPSSTNVTCLVLDQESNNNNTTNNNYQSVKDRKNLDKNTTVASGTGINQQYYQSNQMKKKPSQSNLLANYHSQQPVAQASQLSRKNLNQISQIEFFDENVRVNHVPQITPRHQDKRKTLAQPNDRYKNMDLLTIQPATTNDSSQPQQFQQPQSTKNENGPSQLPLSIISNFENYYSRKENVNDKAQAKSSLHQSTTLSKKQQQILIENIISTAAYQSNPNPVPVSVQASAVQKSTVIPNKRYQEESEEHSQASSSQLLLLDSQRSAFEMKRRSCGPPSQTGHYDSTIQNGYMDGKVTLGKGKDLQLDIVGNKENQNTAQLLQSQRVNNLNPGIGSGNGSNGGAFANAFGLRKFSQQLQLTNKLTNKQDEMLIQSHLNQVNNQHAQSKIQVQKVISNNLALQQQQQQQQQQKQPDTVRRLSKGNRQQEYQQQQYERNNPKDEIVNFFSKYIKQTKQDQNQMFSEDTEYEETIQNLKDFLQYLEDKNIINCKKLENDKEEMTNLIQDLMKLDLNKFSYKQSSSSITCKNSPTANYQSNKQYVKNEGGNSLIQSQQHHPVNFSHKRNSTDYYNPSTNNIVVDSKQYSSNQNYQKHDSSLQSKKVSHSNIQSPVTTNSNQHEKRSIPRSNNNQYKHKLPLNSPNQDYNSRSTSNDHTPATVGKSNNGSTNIVCYYAPVNVNGNNNVVNTNFQIFPAGGSSQISSTKNSSLQNSVSQSKQFNCSQKLFNSNKNSFDIDEQQHQLAENLNPANVIDLISNLKNSQILPLPSQQQQPIFFQQPPTGPTHKRVNSIGSGLQTKKVSSLLITPSSSNANFNHKLMNFGFGQQNKPQQQQQQQYVQIDQQQQQQRDNNTYLNDKYEQLQQKLSNNGKRDQQKSDQQLMQLQMPPYAQQQNQIHFHQRKNSLFLQQQLFNQEDDDSNIQLRNKFYPQQQQQIIGQNNHQDQNEEEEDVVLLINNQKQHKSRLTHRRATTNLIQPSSLQQLAKNIQTIQPPTPSSGAIGMSTIQMQQANHQIISQNGQAVFNDDIGLIEERDKLIKYIKLYTQKRLEIPTTTLDYYKFMKLIGKGAFGKVTLGIHKLTGKQVAIKTVDKSLMKDEYQKKKVLQEVHLLKKVRHQNVIRLLEVFESPKHLLMVMEYAGGGDLLQYVKKRRRLEEDEARKIFRQIVYGLAHCHCRSVLHRDIKLDNILLDNEGEIKICDFGVSRIIKKNQRITEQCGTPAYIAPEIISDTGYEGFNADIWSLGVLLYAMICGTVPFKAQNMHDLHQIITSGSFSYPPQVEPMLSNESKDLINKMLVINPHDRITIPEILSHPWMINKDDMLLQDEMLDFANGTFLNKKDMFSMGSSSFPSHQINESSQTSEPDINQVQIDNLFPSSNSYTAKLSYTDYCAITQDFATMHMNEEALQVMEGMGLPRKMVREGLNKGELNHATATYNLLVLN